jgi:hypothetical protein
MAGATWNLKAIYLVRWRIHVARQGVLGRNLDLNWASDCILGVIVAWRFQHVGYARAFQLLVKKSQDPNDFTILVAGIMSYCCILHARKGLGGRLLTGRRSPGVLHLTLTSCPVNVEHADNIWSNLTWLTCDWSMAHNFGLTNYFAALISQCCNHRHNCGEYLDTDARLSPIYPERWKLKGTYPFSEVCCFPNWKYPLFLFGTISLP